MVGRGLTVIELIVVMGIMAVIITATSFNLLSGQRQVVKSGMVEQVVADVRSQQSKTMSGDGTGSTFGVHFDTSSYVLFTGSVYDANDSSNFVVSLDNNVQFVTSFSGNNIIFTPVSGEVTNYVSGSDTISVIDATDNSVYVLHVNQYGVVDTKT